MSYPDCPHRKVSEPSAPYPSTGKAAPPPYTPYPRENGYPTPPYPLENFYPKFATSIQMPQPQLPTAIINESHPGTPPQGTTVIISTINYHGDSPRLSICPVCHICECEHRQVYKPSPTVRPTHPFHPQDHAEELKKAMKGKTDEKTIIEILANRSNAQRLDIACEFSLRYGKELVYSLKNDLKGKFEDVIVAMMTPLPDYYAQELHEAIHGDYSDEVLVEILCTLSNAEIRAIRKAYERIYLSSLECDLRCNTSCSFKNLMASLCLANREETTYTNPQIAHADAKALHKAGDRRFGGLDSTFNVLITQRSYPQLRLILEEYHKISGHKLQKNIKKEFSGDLKDVYLAVVKSIKNPPAFFARKLHKKKHHKEDLIRIVVTRSEIDMGDIKREYAEKYKKSLAHCIKNECSGDYKKCLLELIGA